MNDWRIFRGEGKTIKDLPPAPRWRQFKGEIIEERELNREDPHIGRRFGDLARGKTFITSDNEIDRVNAALYLRRPLLITGKPGTGKSSLAYAVAYELQLGPVLRWPITSRSTLQEGLYRYDAIGRLQEAQLEKRTPGHVLKFSFWKDLGRDRSPAIGKYIRLGPLGTALLPASYPRVLLIDEIDKSDIDLPNDLLNIFEEGEFEIPELSRMAEASETVQALPYDGQEKVTITKGRVLCNAFPFVVLTSNGERELPAPFLRRCIRLDITEPSPKKLEDIVKSHFEEFEGEKHKIYEELIEAFLKRRKKGDLATDQLLNAIYLTAQNIDLEMDLEATGEDGDKLIYTILRHLNTH